MGLVVLECTSRLLLEALAFATSLDSVARIQDLRNYDQKFGQSGPRPGGYTASRLVLFCSIWMTRCRFSNQSVLSSFSSSAALAMLPCLLAAIICWRIRMCSCSYCILATRRFPSGLQFAQESSMSTRTHRIMLHCREAEHSESVFSWRQPHFHITSRALHMFLFAVFLRPGPRHCLHIIFRRMGFTVMR
jgi:hypothetical protein